MFRLQILSVLALVAFIFAAGCNTEGMWVQPQHLDGPTTSMSTPDGLELPDIQIIDAREVDIVENLLTHRAQYSKMLTILRDYYKEKGYNTKRQWADSELSALKRIKPFKYILSAEVPVTSLRPTDNIAEADQMYKQGLEQMKQGGHGIPALYRQDLMREALATFTGLITKYPSSDKIDDAAFCCGEILKEYFKNQERLALKWYERAHTWDPQTPHPALFSAAVVYDFRLHDRAKALEYYHRVIEEEQGNRSNAAFSSRRVYELTKGMDGLQQPVVTDTREPVVQEPESEDMVPVIDLGPDSTN